MRIEDGKGQGNWLHVNGKNEGKVFAVIESEIESATDEGLAYNLNSGEVSVGGTGDATLLYFKNDEAPIYVIDAIAVGLQNFTAITGMAKLTLIKNPTAGDLLTDETAADIKSNSNFGSSNTLGVGTLLYKGKAAGTVTGGTDHAIVYAGNNGRVFAALPIELPRGGSIAIKIESDATAGTAYAAFVGHLKDPERNA